MATRSNRFFNNPEFARIASNLSGMFAPPSAGDTLAYEQAAAQRQQAQRMSQLWSAAGDDFDRMGVASGQWNPSQSYYAVDQSNATTRRGQDIDSRDTRYGIDVGAQVDMRGQDVTATTSRTNNLQDNQFGLAEALATQTVGEGERALGTTILDDEIAQAAGLVPGMSLEGREAPVSPDDILGAVMGDMVEQNPQYGRDLAMNELDTTKIAGPEGGPQYAFTGRAAELGLPAYEDRGGQAARDILQWYDPETDTRGTVEYDPNGGGMTPMNGSAPPPPSAQFFEPGEPVGTSADLGIGQPAGNIVDRNILQIDQTVNTIDTLSEMIAANPSSQGLVGDFRGFMQNAQQTGNELGQFFGGKVEEVNRELQNGGAYPEVAQAFDPSLPAIEVMSNVLAFQYAKTLNDDRLSNEMLLQARRALGLENMMANQADSLSRLATVRDTLQAERSGLLLKKTGGLNAGAPPAQNPTPGPSAEDEALFQKYGIQ